MPDIRCYFGSKDAAAPAKTAAPKNRRSSRKFVIDSDDDEPPAKETNVAKAAPKVKAVPKGRGIETTASEYFSNAGSSKPSQPKVPQAEQTKPKTESPLRVSPRHKEKEAAAARPQPDSEPATSASRNRAKKVTTAFRRYGVDDDGDAYMDDGDGDGDDIFAADAKTRGRGADEYEEASGDDDVPAPSRVASEGRAGRGADAAGGRKRKSPEPTSGDDEEEEEEAPRKKAASSKPKTVRAPRAKKDEPEDAAIQSILDEVPLVRPPTPPPKDPNAKFDWRRAQGGGGSAAPPNPGGAEVPEGADGCLTGLTFVFTGVLRTVSREDGQALVKRYGGKVTGQPSSKTSFVVLGDDAGPSKLEKIRKMGIKTINEEGLFDLVRRLPAHGGSGKGALRAAEKKQAEEQKARDAAAGMEQEEAARKLEQDKAAREAAAARGIAAAPPRPPPAQLWTSKYAPTQLAHICGNKAQVEKIQNWLKNWPKNKKWNFSKRGADGMGGARAIIVSGPPGVGKTTAAHLAAELEGYDVLESNASDARSKKLVENGVADVTNNTSLLGFFAGDGRKVDRTKKKIVLIMDEVDGMSAGDRGGVGALAKFCRTTEVPLILICNERRLPKMKPFDHVAFDVRFSRPTVENIRSRMMTICHREGLRLPPAVLDALIEGANKDIRQVINMISTARLDQATMSYDRTQAMTKAWEKHVILKPWDICQKMLGGGLFAPSSKATLNDKIELYFNDHDFSFLMIQENYLRTKPLALGAGRGAGPDASRAERLRTLELFDAAAASISDGDLVDRMIHGPQQHWSLMPAHAVFSSVRPASFVAGQLMGSTFTSWLGNNSKYGKLARLNREIHSHMRLRSSGDHNEVRQQYLPALWNRLVRSLSVDGTGRDAVDGVIDLMDSYFLTRDDFDAIRELGVGPQSEDLVTIETQTKASFTRCYNSRSHPVPFMKASNVVAPRNSTKEVPDLEEAIEEEDEEVAETAEAADEDGDLKDDKYIKQPKPKAKRVAAKKNDDDDGDAPKKGKGKAKGKKK